MRPPVPAPTKRKLPTLALGLMSTWLAFLSVAQAESPVAPAQVPPEFAGGAKIYSNQCIQCHGNMGQGVETAYPEPLTGDSSIGELSELIADTMPEEDPETCVGEDAQAVAKYIHYAFYSEAARLRNRPPRITLARLTANQLRQSISDLYAHFEGVPQVSDKRGVKSIYFDGARWKDENKKIERTDDAINFDFGNEGPGSEINPKAFLIYWEGGLYPEVSGTYQITVRSTCSFTMDFGKADRTFIDNHVQSGDKTEFRESIFLIAGRVYPFKIQFVQRNRSTEIPPASISLSWTPPNQTEEIIPTRNLIPGWAPPTFSLQADLPADDRSYGFERGIAINRQWDESTTTAALEFAEIAIDELWPQYLRKNRKDEKPEAEKLKDFLAEIATVAFRESLTDQQRHLYVDKQADAVEDFNDKIKRSILITLKSPRFLYPTINEDASLSQQHANLLALTLFDSLPADDWLLKLVAENQLETEQQVRDAARKMVNDYRTRAKVQDMLLEWLNLSHLHEITKNAERFPEFNEQLASDLRTSLLAQLDRIVWSEASDFRDFFRSTTTFTTPRLEQFYGEAWAPAAADDQEGQVVGAALMNNVVPSVSSDTNRHGILTHPLLMSGLAYHDSTSPIHRGVFLIRYMLGRTLRPPNEAFTPLSPDLHPDLTTRQRVDLQTSPESCQICHTKINGLGFALENFDAVGRFREQDGELPIDSSGNYTDRLGNDIQFNGADELADYLTASQDSHQAFVARAFQHFVKQPPAAYGVETLSDLTQSFQENDFNIQKLIAEIAVIAATQQ